ncbi:MAG: class D sortase [Candidatus Latescibacterota bacterium]|nr:MAG: class D sortase [Candidatus Latescibacterota bacterium]
MMRAGVFLAVVERLLFVAGGVLLGTFLYHRIEAELFEREQTRRLEEVRAYLENEEETSDEAAVDVDSDRADEEESLPGGIEILGRITAPRIGLSAVIIDSVEPPQLDLAVGHFPETPLFGEGGNVALAGHRDFHFAPLRRLTLGDTMIVTTVASEYYYVVDSLTVVDPSAVHVLDATEKPRLTLVTCYPFDYVGPAPHRFIVRASEIPKPFPGASPPEESRSGSASARASHESSLPGGFSADARSVSARSGSR